MSSDPKENSSPLAEISHGPSAFEAFLDKNVKGLIVVSVVAAIAVAGVVVYRELEKNKQEDAGAQLVKAKDLAGYQGVADKEKGTTAGGSAMILLANAQWTDGKKDEAVSTLQKFISENPEHPALATAKASLGAKLAAQGKTGDAAKVLEEVVADPAAKYIAPLALITLGDIARAGGDVPKAEEAYNKVKSQFPDSRFNQEANSRISTLKAKPPVEIDPPPAPPAPPAGADDVPPFSLTPGAPPSSITAPEPAPEAPEAPAVPESAPAGEQPAAPEESGN